MTERLVTSVYSPYGLINSDASGNAGTGLKSNGNAYGSYYLDPESGLLYARARYFDPASGQFIGRDPQEGEANLAITWGAYQYGRYNPYRYTDPNGECDSLSDCSIKAAGGVVGGIGLTAVKAIEGGLGTEGARGSWHNQSKFLAASLVAHFYFGVDTLAFLSFSPLAGQNRRAMPRKKGHKPKFVAFAFSGTLCGIEINNYYKLLISI